MPRLITEKTFFQYLKCPSWVSFDAVDSSRPHDPLLSRLMDDGLLPEKEKEILSDREDLAEVTAEDWEEAFLQTLTFMREGCETIYHGVLIHGHWVGTPDMLARVEGRSVFGNYYYVAADLKRARELRDDYKFQGCFYAELLERLQGTKPTQGYVLTPDRSVLAYRIDEFEHEYRLTLHEIERIVAGEKPPHFLTSGCKQSPWFSVCREESESCQDLSVLNRVWREEVRALQAAGVTTVAQLADSSFKDLDRRVSGVKRERLEAMRIQAMALQDHQYRLLSPVAFPSSEVEVYFDVESDPLRDFEFLLGVLEVKKGEAAYHSFFAASAEEEKDMWNQFMEWMETRAPVPIYHYGWFERDVVKRLSDRYGVSEIVRQAFEQNMIDLLALIRPAIVFPLSFYSLKDLASYVGFTWRAKDASGSNAVLWFESWLKRKRKALLQKIIDYNEDDVRATWALKQWVEQHAK